MHRTGFRLVQQECVKAFLAAFLLFFSSITLFAPSASAQSCCDSWERENCLAEGGIWKALICECRPVGSGPESPIIISLSRNGFRLTSASNGVQFDLDADGNVEQTAWTAANSDDVLLVLDRNENGRIDNGKELFGNITEQPSSPAPNGFLALAVFDISDNGGNGDGTMDMHDSVFSSLRLWRDSNHNGVSEPNELFTLSELEVQSVSLRYQPSHRIDKYGNVFRYRARVNEGLRTSVALWAYDVFFATQ